MGIKGLAKLLSDEAPECIREIPLNSLHGRKIAVDASMQIYQFLIAIRTNANANNPAFQLTNAAGETTSHIQGLFNRTIRFLTEGIRPVFVFDGRPPQFKSGELKKRRERREKAKVELKAAKENDNAEEQTKQEKRLVVAGQKENEDCRKLLKLMGVPVVKAPCEAEAQCAALCKAGAVYAIGTEDMDALTFATPLLLRKMTFANSSKSDIQMMDYSKAVKGLDLTHEQFVDLCILLGCDYCDSIGGIGPKTALKLIREHKCIETILDHIKDEKKYRIPDEWIPKDAAKKKKDAAAEKELGEDYDTEEEREQNKNDNKNKEESKEEEEAEAVPIYVEARKLFLKHDVLEAKDVELKWKSCDVQGLTSFLVDECGFNAERVKGSIEKLQKAHKANSKPQLRMDNFFKAKAAPNAAVIAAKRKAAKEKEKSAKKSKKTVAKRKR